MNNNRVQLTGNLGKDPEIKQFENSKLATFSMATKEEFRTKTGEMGSKTNWHNISAWGKVAEQIEAELKKGAFVTVEGRLNTRDYTDKQGQKRYITEVVATEVQIRKAA